jgi:hypothetical protein
VFTVIHRLYQWVVDCTGCDGIQTYNWRYWQMGGKGQALHYRNRQAHSRKGTWTNAYGNRIQVP